MIKLVSAGLGLLLLPLAAMFALVVVAAGATSGTGVAAGYATFNPSEEAIRDIPPGLIDLYTRTSSVCVGLPWQILAGVARVESNHGRFGGATVAANGDVYPPIIGIPLNGTNGTAAIADTDGGQLDGDTVWDRAVGPFQFIPSSWAIFGVDANGDGTANPHNMIDASAAAVAHLCPSGAITDIEAALFSYNRSTTYVDTVLDWARRYTGPLASIGVVIEGYTLPVPGAYATEQLASRPHHDYPAWDVATPVGTPLFAITSGTITVAIGDAGIYTPGGPGRCGNTIVLFGTDEATYTYCHLDVVLVAPGEPVAAGALIGTTGGQPGTPGAGSTTGPHLHFAVRVYGQSVCPQPLLLAIGRRRPLPPAAAPTHGCTNPGDVVDWPAWLDQVESQLSHPQ